MQISVLCAHLMVLAYKDVTLDDVKPLGMTWVMAIENGASYVLLTGDGHRVFIVPRGTDDLMDVRWDWRFIKTNFPGGGRVHRGFHAAFLKIWPQLKAELDKLSPKVERIGAAHSLGGSILQQIAALTTIHEAHVFGCPRTGNQDFVDRITCPGTRWEARFDPVTGLPFRFGPVQAISAWCLGRKPSRFTQPWQATDVDSAGHSSSGYLKAMENRLQQPQAGL